MDTINIWYKLLMVGVSGGIGACCRYLIEIWVRTSDKLMGLSTWIINSTACFLIGIFAGWLVVSPWNSNLKTAFALILMTGFCGGFSTFSTFTLDCVKYFEAGDLGTWLIFAFLTLFVGLFACAIGYWLGQRL